MSEPDYGEGKTFEQESEDARIALAIAIVTSVVTLVLVVIGVLLVVWL